VQALASSTSLALVSSSELAEEATLLSLAFPPAIIAQINAAASSMWFND
jgi:hypothetical protein